MAIATLVTSHQNAKIILCVLIVMVGKASYDFKNKTFGASDVHPIISL